MNVFNFFCSTLLLLDLIKFKLLALIDYPANSDAFFILVLLFSALFVHRVYSFISKVYFSSIYSFIVFFSSLTRLLLRRLFAAPDILDLTPVPYLERLDTRPLTASLG